MDIEKAKGAKNPKRGENLTDLSGTDVVDIRPGGENNSDGGSVFKVFTKQRRVDFQKKRKDPEEANTATGLSRENFERGRLQPSRQRGGGGGQGEGRKKKPFLLGRSLD